MSDIRKCGITFPHYLLEEMSEFLEERFPFMGFADLKLFHNSKLHGHDGDFIGKIQRGYCLGMANRYCSAFLSILGMALKASNPS